MNNKDNEFIVKQSGESFSRFREKDKIKMEESTLLEQAQAKIAKQQQQLEEAAEIWKLQQSALKTSEQQRKLAEQKLEELQNENKLLLERQKSIKTSLQCVHEDLLQMTNLLNENSVAEPHSNSGTNILHGIRSLVHKLKGNVMDKMEQQRRMKCEIGVLRKTLEEMQKSVTSGKLPDIPVVKVLSRQSSNDSIKIPVVKLEKLKVPNIKKEKTDVIAKVISEPLKAKLRRNIVRPKDGKWVTCTKCEQTFPGNWALIQHERKNHSTLKVVEKLMHHQKEVTKFSCPQCGFTYKSRDLLQNHQKICCTEALIVKAELLRIDLDTTNSSDDEEESIAFVRQLSGKSIYVKRHV